MGRLLLLEVVGKRASTFAARCAAGAGRSLLQPSTKPDCWLGPGSRPEECHPTLRRPRHCRAARPSGRRGGGGTKSDRRASDRRAPLEGALERAIAIYEVTLAQREQVLGDTRPDTLTSRNNLIRTGNAAETAQQVDTATPVIVSGPQTSRRLARATGTTGTTPGNRSVQSCGSEDSAPPCAAAESRWVSPEPGARTPGETMLPRTGSS